MTLIGPKITAREAGMEDGDLHLVVNDQAEIAHLFLGDGTKLDSRPALARGQGSDTTWNLRYTDTPPGLWLGGQIYRDYNWRPDERTARMYGWFSIALSGLEDQERRFGRSGIMLHGGGSALGAGAWAPHQPLIPTLGCIRMHNADMKKLVEEIDRRKATLFVSVYQEEA